MDSNSKNTAYGECRCCLTQGNHRNIIQEYLHEGVREVYIEIFMDCFNLFLSSNSTLTTLICSDCINRLRDASAFRTLVTDTEKQLLSAVNSKMDTVFVNVPTDVPSLASMVKSETITIKVEELSDNEDDVVFDSDSVSTEDLFEPGSPSALVAGEAELLARFPREELAALPTRTALYKYCPQYVTQLDMLKNRKITSNMVQLSVHDHKKYQRSKDMYISEKLAHMTNASTLLQYSNLTPFKSKKRSGYPCFYCRCVFEDFQKLKEHTLDHKAVEISRVLKQYGSESLVVYAEVTGLACNICSANIPNINELKSHLIKVHKKVMYPEVSDRVIPFKMSGDICECSICEGRFETFGSIERHMNGHYRNYICKDCGTGFVTKYRLKTHVKNMHVGSNHTCEFCGKIFSSLQKHKNHVNHVHKLIKRFTCVKCPQRFTEYFRRQRHMEQAHGYAQLNYKCNVCDRSFDRRYTLSRHLKRDHLEERDYQCEVCAYKCFTKNELKVHMVKHNGERIFECPVCKKSYARKKTLKEHLRIHNNDRRYACAVCGQAFVQKCSLKGHLKTHHLDFNL